MIRNVQDAAVELRNLLLLGNGCISGHQLVQSQRCSTLLAMRYKH